jgi:hypothetical protein
VQPGALQAWSEAACLGGLVSLDLGNNYAREDLPGVIARAGRLRELSVDSCRNGPEVVRAIAENPRLSGLRTLNLADTHLDDEALERLARIPHLAGLRFLDLNMNYHVTDAGARALIASSCLGRRLRVSLDVRQVSRAVLQELWEWFGE